MTISPTLHTAGLAGVELAINSALKLDPATQQKLSALSDHVFHLQLTLPELDFYLIPGNKEIRLCGIFDGNADTRLAGSASEFFQLATSSDPANTLINGKLELHGDSHALIELQKIGQQLDLDWEAPLASLFGDVAGHQLGRKLRKSFSFASQALKGLQRQITEYIKEESDVLPPRWEAERFYNEIDNIKCRTERLEAKLQKLRKHAPNTSATTKSTAKSITKSITTPKQP